MTAEGQFQPAAEGNPADGGNHRLRREFEGIDQRGQRGACRRLAEFADVGAGGKSLAGTGQHDGLHPVIGQRLLETVRQPLTHRLAQGIHRRAVDGNDPDLTLTAVMDDLAHLSSAPVPGCYRQIRGGLCFIPNSPAPLKARVRPATRSPPRPLPREGPAARRNNGRPLSPDGSACPRWPGPGTACRHGKEYRPDPRYC